MTRPIALILQPVRSVLTYVGGASLLFFRAVSSGIRPPYHLGLIMQEMDYIGVRSLTVVNVIAIFTGMVLALQAAYALSRFGAKGFIGLVVAISLM